MAEGPSHDDEPTSTVAKYRPTRRPRHSRTTYVPPEPRKGKSVTFHTSTSLPIEKKIFCAADCMRYMMEGSSLIKVKSNSRQYRRFYSLTEDLYAIRWTPSSKKSFKAQLLVEDMKEISIGKNTSVLRSKNFTSPNSDKCAFSIIYGDKRHSLDLIASTREEATIWITGLCALVGIHTLPPPVEEMESARTRWLEEMYEHASTDESGYLDDIIALKLIQRHSSSNPTTTSIILQKISEVKNGEKRGGITRNEFISLFKEIVTRPEVYFLLIRIANKDYLCVDDLHLFLEGEQGISDYLNEASTEIVTQYELTAEALARCHLLVDGFTNFLLSEVCDAFNPIHRDVCQNMREPLTHYYISSSHNTYLLEDQLKGPSGVDAYVRALSNGCRCIKVDCVDGSRGPLISHFNTETSKIPFKECIKMIRNYAFRSSQYPLFIYLENHCSVNQQHLVACILRSTLDDMLYRRNDDEKREITEMTPYELRGKIILMGKKLSPEWKEDVGEVTDEDDSHETVQKREEPKKICLCKELSDLFIIARCSFTDVTTMRRIQSRNEISSFTDASARRLVHLSADEIIDHNKLFFTQIYPNESRIDSSNYNPQYFWNCGCQFVALNFQTPGEMMDLYDGMFKANGGCGYVLKPSVMRDPVSLFRVTSRDLIPGLSTKCLHLKIISGQHLPRPRGSTAKGNIIDPYVVIQLHGIPVDCTEQKTRTVSNEGNCPIYEESFEFEITLPELLLIRFVVMDADCIGDDFIGQYTIPFECLQTGYRHIRLLSYMGEPLENSTLFVHVAITNKNEDGKASKKKSKGNKGHKELHMVGTKQLDDTLEDTSVPKEKI